MNPTLFERLALSLPAPWIDGADRELASFANRMLGLAVDQFNDALVACIMFKPIPVDDVRRRAADVLDAWTKEDPVETRVRILYARSYVESLDRLRAFVKVLSDQPGIPAEAKAACEIFLQQYGRIRDIRNSLQHIEERAQAKGPGGRKLAGPILDLGSLMNDRWFGITTGENQHIRVEISEQFLKDVRSALLRIVWSFQWIHVGNTRVLPPEGADA
ncbi:MAG: hypothetical protein ABSE56_00610 [Bryobacteraceae bacterium]|jgi:hypothetical protein